jgi:hypothetical protein
LDPTTYINGLLQVANIEVHPGGPAGHRVGFAEATAKLGALLRKGEAGYAVGGGLALECPVEDGGVEFTSCEREVWVRTRGSGW